MESKKSLDKLVSDWKIFVMINCVEDDCVKDDNVERRNTNFFPRCGIDISMNASATPLATLNVHPKSDDACYSFFLRNNSV